MIWLFLLLAIAAFALALKSSSIALAVVCLLLALGFIIAFVMGLLARRISSKSADESQLIDPQELRRLREQADMRRNAEARATASVHERTLPSQDSAAP